VPLHAALDLAALRTGPFRLRPERAVPTPPHPPRDPRASGERTATATATTRRTRRGAILTALTAAALLLALSSTSTFGATMVTPKCDDVNLRTGPSTGYARKTNVDLGARVTVVKTVAGGFYGVNCAGRYRSGSYWRKISAINGRSVLSLYGVKHVYGASKLFKTLVMPTPSPTMVPKPAPATAAPTAAPTPDPAATAAPTAGPTAAPTAAPPTAAPTAAPTPPPGPVTLPSSITFYGRGYGHGVGLSQYGAHGRALDGQAAAGILAHYYQGTTLGAMSNKQVRVLVLQAFAATPSNPAQVYGRGGTWAIDGIAKTFPADARLRFVPSTSGTTTTWQVIVNAADGTTLHKAASASSIRVRPGAGTTLQLWSKPSAYDRYRGVLRLIGRTGATAKVNVVNELPMETYLRGVVPGEVPATWPVEAVKAQTIAARSYAAYRLHPNDGTFDMYDDTRSQVYLGKLVEKAGSDAAISATAGVVLRTSTGGIANALFSSTGGGATEHNENVFVSETGAKVAGVFSYLRGSLDRRPDGTPYDAASPYAAWTTKTYTLAQIQSWFAADSRSNVGTLVALDLRNRGVSGRLISVTLIGANGTTKKVSGSVFRAIFNEHRPAGDRQMRSTLFGLAPIP
jgi:SpoIID/LytB domain protein